MKTSLKYNLYRNFWIGLDWLFPPDCGGCGKSGTRWCLECQKKIKILVKHLCVTCGLPQINSDQCARCQKKQPSFKMLRSWVAFENPVKEALHQLKYRRDIGLGEALSSQFSDFINKLNWPIDILIPIPLGKERLKERGYNQVAMIAAPLSTKLGLSYSPKALSRSRETRSQVGLSVAEREKNVQGAFRAEEKKVNGINILLMDDVSTTGATLSAAADALRSSGAKDVYAVTIARALPHHSLKSVT